MKISVIIPTYKPGNYIFDCLAALQKQSFDKTQFEVLIVLNGCNEPWFNNLQNHLNKEYIDININLIQVDTAGVSNARNLGIEYAKGEYITFVDDDDIISDNYLESLYNVSSEFCIGCANSFSFVTFISEKKTNFITEAYEKCQNIDFNFFRYRQFLSPPYCKLIHRDIIGKKRFPINLKRSEDSVFCLSLSQNIKQMRLASRDCIYYIRERPGSATRQKITLSDEISQLCKIECEYLKLWIPNILSIDFKLAVSRMIAGFLNFWHRITQ